MELVVMLVEDGFKLLFLAFLDLALVQIPHGFALCVKQKHDGLT